MNSKIKELLLFVLPLLFIAIAAWKMMYDGNEDVLYMIQLNSYFAETAQFFSDCMQMPGGLLTWAALWLTQLFYNPATGVSVLAALWMVVFAMSWGCSRMRVEYTPVLLLPVACLVVSVVQMGYWMYFLKFPGYYFQPTLGILSIVLLAWLGGSKDQRVSIAGCVVSALAFPLVGAYSPIALLAIAVAQLSRRRWLLTAMALLLAIATPPLAYSFYDNYPTDRIYTIALPFFEQAHYTSYSMMLPILLALAMVVAMPLLRLLPEPEGKRNIAFVCLVNVVVMVMAGYYVNEKRYTDDIYRAECAMYRAIDDGDWDGALDAMRTRSGEVSRQMIILKNIALFHKHTSGDEMYNYPDDGIHPRVEDDSLHVVTTVTVAPLVYLHHGLANYAYRWAMENSVEWGPSISRLKIMAMVAAVNGEPMLQERYVNMLHHTRNYKEWQVPDVSFQKELRDSMQNFATTDRSLMEKFLIEFFSVQPKTGSKSLAEIAMAYALMSKDIKTFWQQFFQFIPLLGNNPMPKHYQEAAFLYGKLEPQTMDTSHMPFDRQTIIDRYPLFMQTAQGYMQSGMDEKAVGDAMRSQFSDSFWWSYYFIHGQTYY